ncbi:MAG TPA: 5-(carboxyamino)imidazole ribonucleotide mutase [Rhodospirillaceae bacterium]|nr:5-(carboxyamino)imidazole ribonucleotide mutase [Rhodospirillaceae bacterium]
MKSNKNQPLVGIIMGSQSDWATMENAANVLDSFGVPFESLIVSAHRTPRRLFEYASTAAERGLKIIIAGAGGAAHLPGMTAALTALPVLGVPVKSRSLDGMDSLLSIAQMPAGIPVGTLAIGNAGAINAALLAVSILGLNNDTLSIMYSEWREVQTSGVAIDPVSDETKPAKKAAKKSSKKTVAKKKK